MADVLRGPWAGPPVRQPANRLAVHWWTRLDDGRLMVQTDTGPWVAPVPPAELTWPLPDKAPDPSRITVALDNANMEGPEVDEALGVADAFDTVVDGWEDGSIIPSQDDMRRLATLTGFGPGWFYRGPVPELEGLFICGSAAGPGPVDLEARIGVARRRGT